MICNISDIISPKKYMDPAVRKRFFSGLCDILELYKLNVKDLAVYSLFLLRYSVNILLWAASKEQTS